MDDGGSKTSSWLHGPFLCHMCHGGRKLRSQSWNWDVSWSMTQVQEPNTPEKTPPGLG